MKIQVASDLHLEFHSYVEPFVKYLRQDVDVLVLAGDITTHKQMETDLSIIADNWKNVVYVTGNHEYYHATKENVHDMLRKLESKHSNFKFLDKQIVTIDGQRFLGATLWFEKSDAPKEYMSDFSAIKGFNWPYQESDLAVKFFHNIQLGDVCISHHLPSHKSTHPKYAGNPLNPFFVRHVEDTIIKKKVPAIWIHGHTHESFDYDIDSTRVICNPFGYLNYEVNGHFDYAKVVEI